MQTQTINTFLFSELPDEIKKKVLIKYADRGTIDWWYENTFEEAKENGIRLTGFDLGRGQKIEGTFIWDHLEVANNILKNIIDMHPLFTISEQFKKQRDEAIDEYKLDELQNQYEKDILWQYWKMLKDEYEHFYSDEYLEEFFDIHEYQFTENGVLYNF